MILRPEADDELEALNLFRKLSDQRVSFTDCVSFALMRRYGIATLAIHTAGTQHAKVELPGLAKECAEFIRDHLIARVSDSNSVAPTRPAPTENASDYGRKEPSAETQEADGAT